MSTLESSFEALNVKKFDGILPHPFVFSWVYLDENVG
jgi:hypothetical protein